MRLPDKNLVQVTRVGTVQLSPDLTLYDVIYVPKFAYNLISTSKLTAKSSCYLAMFSDHFVIQPLPS